MALDQCIGAVANHCQHALVAKGGKRGLVCRWTDKRVRVQLPIAGMHDGAVGRADGQALGFWRGVGHAQKLQAKRTQLEATARRDHVDLHLVDQMRLGQLAAQDGRGERGGIDRAAQLAPKMRNRTHVVLVRVGDHQAQQLVPPLRDKGGVGHDHIGLGQFVAAEADAAVDGQPVAVTPIQVEVHANLTRPAQRQEGKVTGHCVH